MKVNNIYIFGFLAIIIVVGIIGVISYSQESKRGEARVANTRSSMQNTFQAIEALVYDTGNYPTGDIDDLVGNLYDNIDNLNKWKGPYWEDIPRESVKYDKWGNSFVYRYPSNSDGMDYDFISKGMDGVLGTEDDIIGRKPLGKNYLTIIDNYKIR